MEHLLLLMVLVMDHHSNCLSPVPKALPYVCLLIAMLFFIYAIIGMQVGIGLRSKGTVDNRWYPQGELCSEIKFV